MRGGEDRQRGTDEEGAEGIAVEQESSRSCVSDHGNGSTEFTECLYYGYWHSNDLWKTTGEAFKSRM